MLTLDALRAFGADVDEGLQRCMNMEAFYLRLVNSLKGDTKVEELNDAIAHKDLDKAFELAHALKGVYGNLSLTPLTKPVTEITELLRKHTVTDYTALLAELTAQKEKLDALF